MRGPGGPTFGAEGFVEGGSYEKEWWLPGFARKRVRAHVDQWGALATAGYAAWIPSGLLGFEATAGLGALLVHVSVRERSQDLYGIFDVGRTSQTEILPVLRLEAAFAIEFGRRRRGFANIFESRRGPVAGLRLAVGLTWAPPIHLALDDGTAVGHSLPSSLGLSLGLHLAM